MPINVSYYRTLADAGNESSTPIATSESYTIGSQLIGSIGPYTIWFISLRSTGSDPGGLTYPYENGTELTTNGSYFLGAACVSYYSTLEDAKTDSNPSYDSTFTVGTSGGYTNWRIAPNSTGTSSQIPVYPTGSVLNPDGIYFLYPGTPCFLEGTTVLCKVDDIETYIPVEQLKPGTLVKTSLNGYKPIILVGKESIQNPGHDERIEERLYKLTPSKYPQLKDDLYLTGGHSVLEFPLTEKQTQDTIKKLGDLYVTEKKYRLLACLDERAEPWASEGTYTIWAFALQHDDVGKNYGVYVNGGLLVESCSEHFLKLNSNMELIAA